MKQLEIIHLRSTGEPLEALSCQIRGSLAADGGCVPKVTIYRRRGLDTDLAVHIRGAVLSPTDLSGLALQIASELKAWGLVEHSSWEETE